MAALLLQGHLTQVGAEMCRHIMSASGAGNVTSHCTNVYMHTYCAIGLEWK